MDQIITHWGQLDIAVNCAGVFAPRAMYNDRTKETLSLESFQKTIDVNLNGTFNVCRLAAKEMAKNMPGPSGERGIIITTASIAATDGAMGSVGYGGAKGGVASMTLPMARDLAVCGIRVVAISPGVFNTPMADVLPKKAHLRTMEDIVFPQRLGQPDEFAHVVQLIAENQMLNACIIRLDAGLRNQAGNRKTVKEIPNNKL
uniref:3-hydroxyacyl-CoA dehydrogenase type-2-like n=1 Tax=Phallusia mammillata TaxID=59560 RepID=A0A6F9DFM0_9ASCI|nr:3-hydroxyacyl-CoA dehydrogenase type-2-like [Phallusia mammillata]